MKRNRPRILHIDDDALMLQLSETVLTASGFEVTTTTDPDVVLGAARENYDLFMIDLLMPRVDGLTLCDQLREAGWDGPILVLSNKTLTPKERRRLTEMRASFMVKLFGPQDLIQRVQECLAEEQWQRDS